MVKIGEQTQQSFKERTYGKVGQQVGAKKTRAEIIRAEQARRSQITPQQRALMEQQRQQEAERVETVSDLTKELESISSQRSQLQSSLTSAAKKGEVGVVEGITVRDKGLIQKEKAIREVLDKLKTGYISKAEVSSYISTRQSSGQERASQQISSKQTKEKLIADVGRAEAQKILSSGKVTVEQSRLLSPTTLSSLGLKPVKQAPDQSYITEDGVGYSVAPKDVEAASKEFGSGTYSISGTQTRYDVPKQTSPFISSPTKFTDLTKTATSEVKESYFEKRDVSTKKSKDGFGYTETELFYVDPMTGTERKATAEEKKEIRDRPKELKATTEEIDYEKLEKKEKVKEFFGDWSWTGKEFAGTAIAKPYILKGVEMGTSLYGKKVSEFSIGAADAFIPTTRGEVAFDVGTFAFGAGIGKGAKIVSLFLTKIPKITKTAKWGVGGAYGFSVGSELISAKTSGEYGSVFGRTSKELALFGGGYKAGSGQPLFSPKIKLIEEPSTKQFFIQEKTAGGKNIFTRVTQTTPAKYKEGRLFTKEFTSGRGQIFVEKPTGVTKVSDPYLLETRKVSKAPKERLSEAQLRTFLQTAEFTPTKKFTYVKGTGGKQKVIGKDVFSTSGVYSFELGKTQPKKYTIDLNKMFKSQRFDIVLGKQRRLRQVIPEKQIFLGETQARTLSWKTGKPIGKVGKEKTIVEEFISPKEGKGFISFRGRGKPSSQEYFQKLYQPTQQIQFPKSRVPSPKVKPTTSAAIITPTSTATVPSVSKYYGTGMYERTDGGLMVGEMTTQQISPMYRTPIKERVMIKERADIKLDTSIKSNYKINLKQLTKTKTDTKIKQRIQIKSKIKMPLKTKQKLITPFTPTKRPPKKPRKPIIPRRPPKKPPFGFDFPSFKLPGTKGTKTTGKKKVIKRQASLVALGQNIFATKKGKGEFSGLTIRPIIIDGKKKKKRRFSEWI